MKENIINKQTWIAVYGQVLIQDGTITLVPDSEQIDSTTASLVIDQSPSPPHAVVKSNIEFDQGTITWEANVGGADARAQLLLSVEPDVNDASINGATNSTELATGLNVLGTPYGFALFKNGKWEALGGTGQGSTLPTGKWIKMKLTARGSNVELFCENVKVVDTTVTLRRAQLGVLLQGSSESSIRNVVVDVEAPTCFAIMQFTEEFDILYRDVIRPVCESYGYKVIRGDDFYTGGQILEDVTRSIRNAALIIADVTPENANVFYEVGFAHAINKPTILLSDRKREKLPFDISGFRTLFYDNTIGGKSLVEERLKKHLDALRPK
ncbi:hypothetical protein ACFQPC_07840 [Herminiimonas glaciei]|uniref:TIR domain-containing protein n=1 Tax=Herminiimonas glaciei TaxID=523788 RepID=A0ABW2IAE5_9BURK